MSRWEKRFSTRRSDFSIRSAFVRLPRVALLNRFLRNLCIHNLGHRLQFVGKAIDEIFRFVFAYNSGVVVQGRFELSSVYGDEQCGLGVGAVGGRRGNPLQHGSSCFQFAFRVSQRAMRKLMSEICQSGAGTAGISMAECPNAAGQ